MTSLRDTLQAFDPSQPFTVPAGWMQGRTVYGGLSSALILQSVLKTNGDLPPLKSMHVNFVGPASGELSFTSQVLRKGKSVTTISGDCQVGDSTAVHSTMLFANGRESNVAHEDFTFPEVEDPESLPILVRDPSLAPACAFNFEMRPAGGSALLSGSENPELLMWVRHLDADQVDPSVALVALADALPPAVTTTLIQRAPMSSASWTVDFVRPAQAGRWFLMRSFSHQAAHGYSLQDMKIWSEEGEIVIWGRQAVAVFA